VFYNRAPVLHSQSNVEVGWFLRDFGYDADLLGKIEVDDRR